MGNTLQNYEELRDNNKLKEGLKTATEIELLFLMASFFQNSLINCDFSLRYEIAFSAIQKLKLFSLLKSKEGLKQATEIELPVLMRVFSKLAYLLPFSLETSRYALVTKAFHCKTAFSATPESEDSGVAEN